MPRRSLAPRRATTAVACALAVFGGAVAAAVDHRHERALAAAPDPPSRRGPRAVTRAALAPARAPDPPHPVVVAAAPRPARARTLHERLLDATPADMNLVLLTVDSLRWDLHYAGNPRALSPNLDRLAASSVVFDRGYALSSYTGRAIGPMMTGRYPTECVRDFRHFVRYDDANVFLAERLRDAGFRTFGASGHAYFRRFYGLPQGMEDWDLSAHPHAGSDAVTTDARIADAAIAMLRRPENTAGRFFLWAHFMDPHTEYLEHPEVPAFGTSDRARYDHEVMFTDLQIGRVLDALEALPAAARTVVVVTADHGEAFHEHGMPRHGVELWDELVRVPWIVRVPGVAPRHVTARRSQIDLVPTLLELLRVPAPAPDARDALSGQSLAGDLLGESPPERTIFLDLPRGPRNRPRTGVIDGGWKIVERDGGYTLFHLDEDPGELRDVFRTARDARVRMLGVLAATRRALRVARELPGPEPGE